MAAGPMWPCLGCVVVIAVLLVSAFQSWCSQARAQLGSVLCVDGVFVFPLWKKIVIV